jgi:hypothetical protein
LKRWDRIAHCAGIEHPIGSFRLEIQRRQVARPKKASGEAKWQEPGVEGRSAARRAEAVLAGLLDAGVSVCSVHAGSDAVAQARQQLGI